MIDHVAIIGAGFSGTLQAINLLRHDGPRATLIERGPAAGEGLAYGAAHPSHVLNVRASNMSALPDQPGHFVEWLTARGHADVATAFIPRLTYGAYLQDLLASAVATAGDRLKIVHGAVVDLAENDGVSLTLDDGTTISADAAVLAVGNLPPHDPPGLDDAMRASPRYFADPWAGSVAKGLRASDTVLLIGTGLTMVDVALLLESSGYQGRIIALSRRGLLPRMHDATDPWHKIDTRPGTVASALVQSVRARADLIGWRNAVDELRPFTQAIWGNADADQRARFLRHLRPWWDVHRHRLAPSVADRIGAMRKRGQLSVIAAKTMGFVDEGDAIVANWRLRGTDRIEQARIQRVVNCTGPLGDVTRTVDPLLRRLIDRGIIRPDDANLGIDVDGDAHVIGVDGAARPNLYALGPMTRGAFWEIVAVPDIRTQTWAVARRLSNAHWVGGEGL